MKKTILLLCIVGSCKPMEQDSSRWDPGLYDKHSKAQFEISKKCVDQFDLSSSQLQTIVELGCNSANIARMLAEKYPHKIILGIDPEAQAIALAKEKHKSIRNLSFINSDVQHFNLKECGHGQADFIGCYHVFHWIPREEHQVGFNTIASNLNENGIVDVFTSAKQETTPLTKAVLRTILKPKWWWYVPSCIKYMWRGQDTLSLLTVPELRALAENAKLFIDGCEETAECCSFDSKQEFTPWLVSILKPYGLEATLQERQEEFANEVVDLYCSEYNPGTSGKIEYHFKGLHLTAHKPSHHIDQ